MSDSMAGRGAQGGAQDGAQGGAQPGAQADAAPDAAARIEADFAAALEDQKLRRERLRHVQEFMSSPAFLDLRDAPVTVSDPPGDLRERHRDLTYRITVLEAVLALLIEEQDMLDRVLSGTPPAPAADDAGPAGGNPADGDPTGG